MIFGLLSQLDILNLHLSVSVVHFIQLGDVVGGLCFELIQETFDTSLVARLLDRLQTT